jgi:hypothetical protein
MGFVFCMGAASAAPATAQNLSSAPETVIDASFVSVTGAAKHEFLRSIPSKNGAYQPFNVPCSSTNTEEITCGSTKNEEIANTDCSDGGHLIDLYSFDGTAGQQVTIGVTSSAVDTYVELYDPSEILHADDDNSGNGTNPLLVFTLDVTGTWYILVGSVQGFETGAYSLTLQCSVVGNCIPNETTLCLNNGRFRVTADFSTPQGQNGHGHAVAETSDTGLFWFFSANNIEVIVKVVSGCDFDLNHRYWVFAAGLTNVQVTLTVTDTSTGETRSYTNPLGTPFAPIQDTNAFASCP